MTGRAGSRGGSLQCAERRRVPGARAGLGRRPRPGINSIFTQDRAVTESRGPVYDRTQEYLGTGAEDRFRKWVRRFQEPRWLPAA